MSELKVRHFPRAPEGAPCDCGGYADVVPMTKEERAQYGCGRPWDCCGAAFVCRVCGERFAGYTAAPEME